MAEIETVKAAGTVVWRRNQEDELEILLIHRPKYSDWSLPKGKAEFGEISSATAYRETIEETGARVKISRYLGKIEYENSEGIKSVDYWSAKYLETIGQPDLNEVDEIKWLQLKAAEKWLSNNGDIEIIQRFRKIDLDAKVLILLRHAKAISRNEWNGEDEDRPLSEIGEKEAELLVSNLIPFQIAEIHSSIATRCYKTVDPLARKLGINYFLTDSLSEDVYQKKPNRVMKYIDRLLDNSQSTLVCSHNPILPDYVQHKLIRQGFEVSDTYLKPGDAWLVHHISSEIVSVDKIEVPIIV